MKLFCRDEMQRLEQAAAQAGTSLGEMMERAGTALADEVEKRCRPLKGRRVAVLCGKGNNGGDGFVCARVLQERGASCQVVLAQGEPATDLSKDAFYKLRRLPKEVPCFSLPGDWERVRRLVGEAEVLVDCVFGFSFRGELSGDVKALLELANSQDCLRVAADLPSGAHCDTGRVSQGAFRAHATVTFTGKKPAHCSYPAKEYCGDTVVAWVGVPAALREEASTRIFQLDKSCPGLWLRQPDPQCNKGSQGKLLLVCGSYGMAGACVMAAQGALRAGVGLVQIALDKQLYPLVAQAVPQAVYLLLDLDQGRAAWEPKLLSALHGCDACVMGCGLGSLSETLCPTVLEHCEKPLVLDADALNYCARHPEALRQLTCPAVLTPHPGEMARLCDDTVPEIQSDRLGAAQMKARETGAVVVLKGAATVIAGPDGRCALNPTGNPGMAKGGSGDVLAGVIGALLAQGVTPFRAGALGAFLHGWAGDLCARDLSQRAMLPTDLVGYLPRVFRELEL